MNPRTERLANRVQAAARSDLARRMAERELMVINKIVLAYRSQTLTSEQLWGAVAAIAELRSVASEAERDLMSATEDSSQYRAGANHAPQASQD